MTAAHMVYRSFCNEAGCEGWRERGGPRFQEVAHRLDGSRPTLANMFTFDDLLSHTVDVQGFSHQSRQKLDACHARLPDKPIYMSECCSCNTFRDEDEGCEITRDHPRSPEVTRDHPRSPEVTRGHPRSPEVTRGHPRLPERCRESPR